MTEDAARALRADLDAVGYSVSVRCHACLMRFGEATTFGKLVWMGSPEGWTWGPAVRTRKGTDGPRAVRFLPPVEGARFRPLRCRRCGATPRDSLRTLTRHAEESRARGVAALFV